MKKSTALTLALLLAIVLVVVGVSVGVTTKKKKDKKKNAAHAGVLLTPVDPYWAQFNAMGEDGSDTDHKQ
jgi:ABC-type molybdate transport system substrate-binding protein